MKRTLHYKFINRLFNKGHKTKIYNQLFKVLVSRSKVLNMKSENLLTNMLYINSPRLGINKTKIGRRTFHLPRLLDKSNNEDITLK